MNGYISVNCKVRAKIRQNLKRAISQAFFLGQNRMGVFLGMFIRFSRS